MDTLALTPIIKLRGLFPGRQLYMGGSLALKRFFFNNPFIELKDLDMFFFGGVLMETWAMSACLEAVGFTVLSKNEDSPDYKIPRQVGLWKLKCNDTGVLVDLIIIGTPDTHASETFW